MTNTSSSRDALLALLERRPPYLVGVSLAVGARGRPILESSGGQLVVPVDALLGA